jgi:hypothetical protein
MTWESVLLEKKDRLATITLNRPENKRPRSKLRGINRKNPIERRSKLRGIKPPLGD